MPDNDVSIPLPVGGVINDSNPTDRVNPVPAGGTITINGKKPSFITLFNENISAVQVRIIIPHISTGLPVYKDFEINPLSSLLVIIDGAMVRSADLKISVANLSGYDINYGYSEVIQNF